MVWFKVDDQFVTHPKVLRIPRKQRLQAVGLWTLAGAWSGAHGTDGRVPSFLPDELGAPAVIVAALVTAGLWEATEDGWLFHDWEQANPTAEDTEAKRAAWRDRQARSRKSRRGVTRDNSVTPSDVTVGVTRESTSPVPSRPVPTNVGGSVDLRLGGRDDENRRQAQELVNQHRAALAERRAPKLTASLAAVLVDRTAQCLAEGSPPDAIRQALPLLDEKRLGPGALASVVREVQLGPRLAAGSRQRQGFDPQQAMADALALEQEGE